MHKPDRRSTGKTGVHPARDWTPDELTELLRPAREDLRAGRVYDFDDAFQMIRDATDAKEPLPPDEG